MPAGEWRVRLNGPFRRVVAETAFPVLAVTDDPLAPHEGNDALARKFWGVQGLCAVPGGGGGGDPGGECGGDLPDCASAMAWSSLYTP